MTKITKETRLVAIITLVALVFCFSIFLLRQKRLEMLFLDVGDGLCVIAKTPSRKIMVFDCGTSKQGDDGKIGSYLVARQLSKLGASKIDVAILSHTHFDHMNGFESLFEKKRPAKLLLPPYPTESEETRTFFKYVAKKGFNTQTIGFGAEIDFGDGCRGKFLSPSKKYEEENDNSLVLKITYGSASVLLAADAQTTAERDMIDGRENLKAAVLQVGHHGSKTSSSQEFINSVSPQIAIISCKSGGRLKYPAEEVKKRLEKACDKVFVTGVNGAVRVVCTKDRIKAESVY